MGLLIGLNGVSGSATSGAQAGDYRVVQDYGAVVYSTQAAALAGTDATSAIQDAIDDAVAAGGGRVVFDPGYYKIAGALRTDRGGRAQIALPDRDYLTSAKIGLVLWCDQPAAPEIYGDFPSGAGAILCSTLTGVTLSGGETPSVIGGPSKYAFTSIIDYFTDLFVTVHGIAVRTPDNPTVTGLDFSQVVACDIRDYRFDTQATPSLISQPTSAHAWGLILPRGQNNVITQIGNYTCVGAYAGFGFSEHTNIYGTVQIYKTIAAMVPRSGQDTIHPCKIGGNISVEFCPYVVAGCSIATGVQDVQHVMPVVFEFVDIEDRGAAGPAWAAVVAHIKDANSKLYGRFRYGRTVQGTGYTTAALTVTGAANLKLEDVKLLAAPVAVPADKTADYTLTRGDTGASIGVDSATAKNVTVPLNSSVAYPVGTLIEVRQVGAGQVTIVATGGVTLRSAGGALKTRAQYSAVSLLKIATDTWSVQGDITT